MKQSRTGVCGDGPEAIESGRSRAFRFERIEAWRTTGEADDSPQANRSPWRSTDTGTPRGVENRKPRRAEGRATEGWPEGRSIGAMQVIGCRRQARRASRFRQNANQIDEKFDEIIDFAEIGEFIDSPVLNYSWTA
jgi:hypothetical protein